MIKKNTFIVSYFLIIIITIISFFLLTHYNVFKKSQRDLKTSIASGFGYYGDPIEGPCITPNGNCYEEGKKKITKTCIVHPVTSKGCLLKDGTMSYDNLVEELACKKQCVASSFTVSDGLQFNKFVSDTSNSNSNSNSNNNSDTKNINTEFIIPKGAGAGYLVDQFGIDYTNTFVESFNIIDRTYTMKRCLNTDEYLGYSINYYHCEQGDNLLAGNKCVFTCGQDDIGVLRTQIINDPSLNINTYNYPKLNGRYTCLDLYGNNQVEVFNQGNIPNDFIYPIQCFQHYVNEGTSTIVTLDTNIIRIQNYYTLPKLDLLDYKLIHDYNFYYPLEVGFEETIVEKIVNTNREAININSGPGWLYLDMERDFVDSKLHIDNFTLNNGSDFYNLQDNNILALNFNLFINIGQNKSDYFYSGSTMYLNDPSLLLEAGEFIWYTIDNPNVDTKTDIRKINYYNNSDNYFGISVRDLGEDAYIYGIKFWGLNGLFDGPINLFGQTGGVSAGDRIEKNKYFISDILLPTSNYTSMSSNDLLVNIYNGYYFNDPTPPTDIFYIFSKVNKAFYYPVSRSNSYTSDYNFTLPEYGATNFYLLEGGISNTIYPPNKDLNYKSFEDNIGFIQGEAVLKSYGDTYKNYIKSFKLLSTGFNFQNGFNSNKFYIYINDFKGQYRVDNLTYNIKDSTVIKKLDSIASDIDSKTESEFNPFIEKMKIYNELTASKIYNFYSDYGTSFNINIGVSRAIVKIADYDVFRTPNIVNSETDEIISKNVCFDSFGKPLQSGTQIQLNPGDKIIYYKNNILNTENPNCGFYGVSNAIRATEERINKITKLGTSTLISHDDNKYYNYLDFLESGYFPEDLYCYQGINTVVESNIKNCREPFTTRIYSSDYYNTNENLIQYFNSNHLYYSNIDTNINSPETPKNWVEVLDYNSMEYVIESNNVYDTYNGYSFVYSADTRGTIGESLAKNGVYYLYKKKDSIFELRDLTNIMNNSGLDKYFFNSEYYQNNWFSETTPIGIQNELREQAIVINNNQTNNYLYNIDLSFNQTPIGTSLYVYTVTIDTGENFVVGDIFNPDFNLFNSLLLNDGISTFSFDNNSGYDELIHGSSIITNTTINSNLAVNNLIFIAYDNNFDFFTNFIGGVSIYNYAFEVCKVLNFDKDLSTVTLERNLLNYPLVNNFSGISASYTAYLLDNDLNKDLLFPINNIKDTKVSFDFNAYSYNTPNIDKILANLQSRTALSARIIKNKITIPNSIISGGNTRLYLMNSPKKNMVSTYIDLMTQVILDLGGQYAYYFNQYRKDNYLNNNEETIFNLGDYVELNINGVLHNLTILGIKKVYNNSLYDYYTQTTQKIFIDIFDSVHTKYYINYFNFETDSEIITNNNLFKSILIKTINPENPEKLNLKSDVTSYLLNSQYYSNLYFQQLAKVKNFITPLEFTVQFFSNIENQISFDTGYLPILKLKSTKLYSDLNNPNSYLTIENITLNTKPYGPSYLKNLVNSNELDLKGYGTITGFTVGINLLNTVISSSLVLSSLSGFKFSFSDLIASFTFKNLVRNREKMVTSLNNIYTYNNPSEYNNDNTYNQNEFVKYGYEKGLFYQNINPRLSLFDYDQAYYILENGFYKYPLYLNDKTGRVPVPIPGAQNINLYYDTTDYIDNGTSIPNLNIYKNFKLKEDLKINPVWKQVKSSIYPVEELAPYNSKTYYSEGSLVFFENNVYSSVGQNYNNPPVFSLNSNWILNNNYGVLSNLSNLFYNKNIGSSTISSSDLSLVSKQDTLNYPISLIDYGTCVNYVLNSETKNILNYNSEITNSFLNLDIFNKQLEVLGKAIIFKNSNNVTTLASSPITSDSIDTYEFLKEYSSFGNNTTLSQFIYNINLPPQDYSGRAFCAGDTPYNSSIGVCNYIFANSITFLPVPVDLEYQDYPKITIQNDIYTYQNPPLVIPKGTNKAIRQRGNNYSIIDVDISKSYYTKVSNTELSTGVVARLLSKNPDTFDTNFTYTVDNSSLDYYINSPKEGFINNEDITLYNNAPWYLNNNIGTVASGYLRLENNSQLLSEVSPLTSFFIGSINKGILEKNNDLNLYLNDNNKITNPYIITMPKKIEINKGSTILNDGEYYFYRNGVDPNNLPIGVSEKFRAHLTFDYEQILVDFDQYYLSNYLSLLENDKVYFLPENGMSNLKIKMYGFFGTEFLSSIKYSSKNTIASTLGQIPNLIFSPFRNNLINPYYNNLILVDSDGTKAIISNVEQNNHSDVFNLASDGTSLTLLTNFYKNPIFDNEGNITSNNSALTSAIGPSGNSKVGVINTNSVIDFIASPFDFNNFITLGNAEDVIPFDDTINDKTQYYREIKAGINTNVDAMLNCSIYNTSESNFYRSGANIDTLIQDGSNGKILNVINQGLSGTTVINNTIPELFYNSTNSLLQDDISNNNYPIYIGVSSGTSFSKSLIYDNNKLDNNTNIILTYNLNNIGISSKTYYNQNSRINFNTFSLRTLNIVLTKNDYFNTIENKTIYLGYKNSSGDISQFSGGVNSLTFIDYG